MLNMSFLCRNNKVMFQRSLSLALLLVLLLVPARAASAEGPAPTDTVAPPAALEAGLPDRQAVLKAEPEVQIAGLKAVLIAGPIDGDSGEWTNREIANLESTADQLEAFGVQVYRFFTPTNDWDAVVNAARGAHFLFYRGHGLQWSEGPNPQVGGMELKDGAHSSDEIRAQFELHPNAIVMLYGCYTAGSSSSETTAISAAEARRRVAEYSDPFFDVGAAGYYANWFGDAFTRYVQLLFTGRTLRETYESYFDFQAETVERYSHPSQPDLALYLDKDDWNGIVYNNAFAGRANETLETLFAPNVGLSRAEPLPVQIFLPAVIN